MKSHKLVSRAVLVTVMVASTASAQPGTLSPVAAVSLNATRQNSLTVTINSGATQTLASLTDNAVNTFATPVNITTAWDLHPSTFAVVLAAYFSNPAQALANGSNFITTSRIRGRVGVVGGFNPFTGGTISGGASSVGVAGGTMQLFSQRIFGFNRTSSRTDDLYLQIDLLGTSAIPGTYTGTLTLRAITQ